MSFVCGKLGGTLELAQQKLRSHAIYSILLTVELHKKNYACSFIQSHSATKAVFGIASPILCAQLGQKPYKIALRFPSSKTFTKLLQYFQSMEQKFRKYLIKIAWISNDFEVSWTPFCHFSSLEVCSTSLLYYDNECMSQFLLNLIL